MDPIVALSIGGLAAVGVYMFLAHDLPRVLIGFVLFGSAVNLTIFASGRLGATLPPFVAAGADALALGTANPLPQALILTAIVIGFGLTVFALMLVVRANAEFRSVDTADLDAAETPIDAARSPLPSPAHVVKKAA